MNAPMLIARWADALASPDVTPDMIHADLWQHLNRADHRWITAVRADGSLARTVRHANTAYPSRGN